MSGSHLSPDADPILAAPILGVFGGSSSAGDVGQNVITNATQPLFVGTLIPGDEVLVFVDDVQISGFAPSSPGSSTYVSIPTTPLAPGLHQAKASQFNPGGGTAQLSVSGYSALVNLLILPAPVNGVTTTDITSAQINALLKQGYRMQFVSGTGAVQLTNGTLSVGVDTSEAVVQRLYKGLLGRTSDLGGMALYNGLLSKGFGAADVANDLLNSPEYQKLRGALNSPSDTQFITDLYQGFFGRLPDHVGLDGWLSAMAQGTNRGQVAAGFAQSDEAKTALAASTAHIWIPSEDGALITQLYKTGLSRIPDLAGLQIWTQALQHGLTSAEIATTLVNSAEFQSDHAGQNNTQLITSYYQHGLGRAPDAAGLQGWIGQLASGVSQSSVLLAITNSTECGTKLSPII